MRKEKEVADIMMVLYDEQEILRSNIESEIYEARQEAKKEAMKEARQEVMREVNIESAKKFLQMKKFSHDEIAFATGLTIEDVEALAQS